MANRFLFFSSSVFALFFVALQPRQEYVYFMPLKYQKEIEQLNPDFTGFSEVEERTSYRWVFEGNDPRNFLPIYKIDEKRYKREVEKGKANFRGWALSFYQSEEDAKKELLYWVKDKPEKFKKLGTHISKGNIIKEDGLCEESCDERGHFDHFENINVELYGRFEIVQKVAG